MKKNNTNFQCVVIGAGVIGLAIAKKLAEKIDVLVLEKNKRFGQETSSRNSGVIHAGIYYPKNSLKAILSRKGNSKIYSYARERGINFNQCGKYIVANNPSEERILLKIKKNASKNGIFLEYKNSKVLKKIEPNLKCYSALYSKSSGIIDTQSLMSNFIKDIENNKGQIIFNSKVEFINICKDKITFSVNKNFFSTKVLINCAGLQSHILADKISKLEKKFIPKVTLVKGSYMKLSGKSPFKKLIYPVPTNFGLGIHSTLNLEGQTIFGPDEEIISKIDYTVDKNKKNKFVENIKKFWPEISDKKIYCDYSGIRTKVEKNDFIIQDQNIHKNKGLINLFGIDSPGLTSSISIGDFVSKKCINFLK